jgi:hypothetical protein
MKRERIPKPKPKYRKRAPVHLPEQEHVPLNIRERREKQKLLKHIAEELEELEEQIDEVLEDYDHGEGKAP